MGEKGTKATTASSRSAESIQGRLAGLGDIQIKKMFGGHGIFLDERMFGLVDIQGEVFLKVDESNRAGYVKAGSQKHSRMPYYSLPESVLGNDAALKKWAVASIDISRKS